MARRKPRHHLFQPKHPPAALDVSTEPSDRLSDLDAVVDPPVGEYVRQRLLSSIAAQQRYAVFDTDFAGVPYQVVARITYADPLREHLESVSGFTVNLDWVRTQYFSDILRDVGPTASGGLTQDVALLDDDNRAVFGSNNDAPPLAERTILRCSSSTPPTRHRISRRT